LFLVLCLDNTFPIPPFFAWQSSTSGGALAGAEQGGGGGAFDFLGGGGSGEEKGSRGAALVDVGLDLGMVGWITGEDDE